MPSHFKPVPTAARGIQKMPAYTHAHTHAHKQMTLHHHINWVVPPFFYEPMETVAVTATVTVTAPAPASSVFDTNDCIWHYGTVYVRDAVAVEKIQGQQQQMQQMQAQMQAQMQEHQEQMQEHQEQMQEQLQHIQEMHHIHDTQHIHDAQHIQKQAHGDDDDDTESTTSGNGNGSGTFKCSRNIGKQNQLKHLKDGMRLRHLLLVDHTTHEWCATFDAETNRIIRTPDGVAFDTLRQFARLHSNEALSIDLASTNVWSDSNFQYQDDASGHWHPLADLKK